ncbi:MAG: hypothetical protein KDD67_07855 [Ignavibacteriae bacterium]|nr:hypothetical protein [Ignavibacteriota bacterium]MCB9215909.1 hypothetical protein [Ignavibacteria bacterium]
MPEFVKLLTDDQNTVTHLLSIDEEFVSVEELAHLIYKGEECYVTFGDGERFSLSMMAEDGRLEPTIDDPNGARSIWDLPSEDDPTETELDFIFDEMDGSGEFDSEGREPRGDEDELQKYH